jgi:hypothetical protein
VAEILEEERRILVAAISKEERHDRDIKTYIL